MNSNTVFALDIGTRSIIGVVAEFEGEEIKIKAQHIIEHSSRAMYDGQIHDINKVAKGVSKVKVALEKKVGQKLHQVAIAAAGRSLKTKRSRVDQEIESVEIDPTMVRSIEITALQKAHRDLGEEQGVSDRFYCVGHTVVSYYLNNYPIANLEGHQGKSIGVEVLATFLPDSVVNSLYAVLQRVELEPVSLTLEPIAAIDIAIPEDVRTLNLALVDIGAGTSDIAITSDGSISAYGMVPVAGDEITEAIVENLLVDFNTAEKIKRKICKGKDISYTDILGMKNTVACEDVLDAIDPIIDKLADKVAGGITSLNGDKSPKTIFCIGGGSQVPLLNEKIAQRLKLPKMRVAVRGRKLLNNVQKLKKDPIGGPDGVTVLGIASIAYKNVDRNFIIIYVNGIEHQLFNASNLTVASALGLVDYNPRDLIVLNGKDLVFTINGERKHVYGKMGTAAQITVNEQPAHLQSEINDGDRIEIAKAVHGIDAQLTLEDLVKSQGFDMGCAITVNGSKKEGQYSIQSNDEIIIKKSEPSSIPAKKEAPEVLAETKKGTLVYVNGKEVLLEDKENPVFVDVFNFIDIDLNNPKGLIVLKVNGEKAEYTQPLADGDKIEIYWEEK
ncbi:MAG: molecular chaperone Hsp70 [Firmicutes bacterium]|nr:molecular chaperone Hsp70 [Bacillota bacterium]